MTRKSILALLISLLAVLLPQERSSAQDRVSIKSSVMDFYDNSNEETGHLRFEGVEINGSLQSVMRNLRKSLKFKPSAGERDPLMKGKWRGDEVDLRLGTIPNHDLVYVLVLTYPPFKTPEAMKSKYESCKLKLTSRFGEPADIDEEAPFNQITVFQCPEGTVTLATSSDWCVRIYYMDKHNNEIAQHEQYGYE